MDVQISNMKGKGSEDEDMSKGMITSIGAVSQGSIKFRKKRNENKKMSINVEYNNKHMYEYGVKCVRIWQRREMRIHI